MANPTTAGDEFFEEYCLLNGYDFERNVPWRERLGVDRKKDPDYLVDRVGDRAIAEVKHFTTMRLTERLLNSPNQTAWFGGRDLYSNIENAIREAGAQLAQFAAVGLPLVVVMTNPTGSDVNFDPDDVRSALFGEIEWRIDPAPGGRVQPAASGSGGVLASADRQVVNLLPHLSAAVALYGLPAFPRVDVYDLSGVVGFTGTALPRTMFDGDDDRWFGCLGEDRYGLLDRRA